MSSNPSSRRARGSRQPSPAGGAGWVVAIAFLGLIAVSARPAAAQPNYQSCGMIPGCVGPMYSAAGSYVYRSFTGCPVTCGAIVTNAYACTGAGGDLLVTLYTTTDFVTRGCDFSCPGQPSGFQNCSIRGADGFPVELMEFSVEPEEPGGESPGEGQAGRDTAE